MTIGLGKSGSFGLLCVFIVELYQSFVYVYFFPLRGWGGCRGAGCGI